MADAKWDWRRLSRQEQTARWEILAKWVAWLQETYEEWVTLPDCWPRHEALRAELEFFRAWHTEILDRGTPSEGTIWHASLRSAADAWEALSSCTPVVQKHLRIAREDPGRHGQPGRRP